MGWNPFAGNIPQTPAMPHIEAVQRDAAQGKQEAPAPSPQPASGALDDAPEKEASSGRRPRISAPSAPPPSAIKERSPGVLRRISDRLNGG